MDDYCLALSGDLYSDGDWTEPLHTADARKYLARSLVVMQEFGPEWTRTRLEASATQP